LIRGPSSDAICEHLAAPIASSSPSSISSIIALLFKHFGVMNVIAADIPAQGDHNMKTFTIDAENNITAYASKKAARESGAPVFASEVEFADLIGPDNKRLVEIYNSLPGVKPVTKFANRKVATERIWKAIQSLGESARAPVAQAEEPATAPEATPAIAASTEPEPSPAAEAAPDRYHSAGRSQQTGNCAG
jgi:hypothetical protein